MKINLAKESNVEMSDVSELESTVADQFPFHDFQSDFISTKQLEKMAEPFQHLFGESFGSKAEINSSVLKLAVLGKMKVMKILFHF